MCASDLHQRVGAVRRFNRFYTQQIGVLQEGFLESPFSLAQVRVLYELAHKETATASELVRDLGLDAGYLSRILLEFRKRGLVDRRPSDQDGRQSLLWLTDEGRKAFAPLDRRSHDDVAAMLARLSPEQQERLVASMDAIQGVLDAGEKPSTSYLLRAHRPGDMGWVVQRHGELYYQEFGYDEGFEALVASIVAEFIQKLDPKRERCWIAERDGENVGCVFLVKKSDEVAKLRLFLVEPEARGLGIGARLVDECIRFARHAGYREIVLWTQSHLDAARRIYQRAGFSCVAEEPHHSFGMDLVAETWRMSL